MIQNQIVVLHESHTGIDPWTPASRSMDSPIAVHEMGTPEIHITSLAARFRNRTSGLVIDESRVSNASPTYINDVAEAIRPRWLLVLRAYPEDNIEAPPETHDVIMDLRRWAPSWTSWRFPSDALGSIVHLWVDMAAWFFDRKPGDVAPRIEATHGPLADESKRRKWDASRFAYFGVPGNPADADLVAYLHESENGRTEMPFTLDLPARIPVLPRTFSGPKHEKIRGVVFRGGPLSKEAVRIWTSRDVASVLGVNDSFEPSRYSSDESLWHDLSQTLPSSFAEALLQQVTTWT